MAFGGSLQDISLPDVLQLLATQGKSGYLTLKRGPESVRIGLADGTAVEVESSRRPLKERLGRMLVGAGRLARADLDRALEVQRRTGKKLGQVLVCEGLVPAADVRRALRLQLMHMMFGVLRWEDGTYDFERAEVDFDRDNVQPLGVQEILMDCMRMIDEWPLVEKRLGSRDMIFQRVARPAGDHAASDDPLGTAGGEPAAEPEPELGRLETELLSRIDGKTSVRQLVETSLELEFDVCRALFELLERNLIAPASEGDLADTDFADILLAVRRARANGVLELERDGVAASVTFRDGRFAHAESGDPDLAIGPHLLRAGAVGRADLAAAGAAGAEGAQAGEWLVRSGRLAADELALRVQDRMERIVLALFGWRAGTWRWRPGAAASPEEAGLAERSDDIVREGIRSIESWSRIERAIGPGSTSYWRVEERCAGLPEPDRRLADLFGDGQTLDRATALEPGQDFELLRAVWMGRVLGFLDGGPTSPRQQVLLAMLGATPTEAALQEEEPGPTPEQPADLAGDLDYRALAAAMGRNAPAMDAVYGLGGDVPGLADFHFEDALAVQESVDPLDLAPDELVPAPTPEPALVGAPAAPPVVPPPIRTPPPVRPAAAAPPPRREPPRGR